MLSSSNYLQSAFECLGANATVAEREAEVYGTFEELCDGFQGIRGQAPARLLAVRDLGDSYYSIDKERPYYLVAQIVNIKCPAEGKTAKEICTENVTRLKTFLSKRVRPGGKIVPGGSKEVLKYNRMVVFRYSFTTM
jgi:hypothetical protein